MSIYELIKAAPQGTLRGADNDALYECPPHVDKVDWMALEEIISAKERAYQHPRSDQYYTLRLDIKGMSALKDSLVADGTFSDKWCPDFSAIMTAVARDLANQYHALWCYTQSDEITIVIAPPRNGIRSQHYRAGKLLKLVSLSAARASAVATTMLTELRYVRATDGQASRSWFKKLYNIGTPAVKPPPVILEFDCRMAVWDTERDAFQLILWRAYDCGVNGISDAIYSQRGQSSITHGGVPYKILMESSTWSKLKWLERQSLLPLFPHQAYGTLFHMETITRDGTNHITQQVVQVIRKEISKVNINNIITATKRGDI